MELEEAAGEDKGMDKCLRSQKEREELNFNLTGHNKPIFPLL